MRSRKTALEDRQAQLSSWLEVQRSRVSSAEAMPEAIKMFLDDFQNMEIHVQKANLQSILKAARVHRRDETNNRRVDTI